MKVKFISGIRTYSGAINEMTFGSYKNNTGENIRLMNSCYCEFVMMMQKLAFWLDRMLSRREGHGLLSDQ